MTAEVHAVVNASPLIFLAELGALDLLPDPTATTPTVLEEVRAGDPKEHSEVDLVETLLATGALLEIEADPSTLPHEPAGLHSGEASILALALDLGLDEPDAQVIVDDREAIRAATLFGLEPTSTPFLLLQRCREGRLSPQTFERKLDRLLDHGYFLSRRLYRRLLANAQDLS